MTITYPLSFPDGITFNDIEIQLAHSSESTTSPFTLETQVYDYRGEVWSMSGSMPPMNRERAEIYTSFLMSLRGQVGTFLIPVAGSETAQGSWGGSPVVDGNSQAGDELNIRGLPVSQTGVAKAGDFISLGTGEATRLHKVVSDADSDASGNMTVTVVPRLRASPIDGDIVTYNNAMGLFRLTGKSTSYSNSVEGLYSMTFEFQEAI